MLAWYLKSHTEAAAYHLCLGSINKQRRTKLSRASSLLHYNMISVWHGPTVSLSLIFSPTHLALLRFNPLSHFHTICSCSLGHECICSVLVCFPATHSYSTPLHASLLSLTIIDEESSFQVICLTRRVEEWYETVLWGEDECECIWMAQSHWIKNSVGFKCHIIKVI